MVKIEGYGIDNNELCYTTGEITHDKEGKETLKKCRYFREFHSAVKDISRRMAMKGMQGKEMELKEAVNTIIESNEKIAKLLKGAE